MAPMLLSSTGKAAAPRCASRSGGCGSITSHCGSPASSGLLPSPSGRREPGTHWGADGLAWTTLVARPLQRGVSRSPGVLPVCAALSTVVNSTTSSPVDVSVERSPANSRRLFASTLINAPLEVVWGSLTDYERLQDFIPGLTENKCLSRQRDGARLLQVGAQDVALGVKFSARVLLDIFEHVAGMPAQLVSATHSEQRFPVPRGLPGASSDIAFRMVEGDFQAFQGVWRMQRAGPDATLLSYALFVRPQLWLPVRLIQSRIEGEVAANLRAVREHAQRVHIRQQRL